MAAALALVTQPLYEIEEGLQALLDTIDLAPSEMLPEIQEQIAEYLTAEKGKTDRLAAVLANLEATQEDAGKEIKRLQARKNAAKLQQERLEQYVCRVLLDRGVKKLEGRTNTLTMRPSERVRITNPELVPLDYQHTKIVMNRRLWISVLAALSDELLAVLASDMDGGDLTATNETLDAEIKRAIKRGHEIPGADIEFRNNLQRR